MTKHKLAFIFLAIAVLLAVMPVQAQNMTISRLGFGSDETVQIYANGTTLYGTWNTTTNGIALPPEDFTLIVKPVSVDAFANPAGWLTEEAFPFVEDNMIGIVLLIILAAIWARGFK